MLVGGGQVCVSTASICRRIQMHAQAISTLIQQRIRNPQGCTYVPILLLMSRLMMAFSVTHTHPHTGSTPLLSR